MCDATQDLTAHEETFNQVIALGRKLLSEQHPDSPTVEKKQEELMSQWAALKELAARKHEKLYDAAEIQKFFRDAEETIAWANEKDAGLQGDDYGHDLPSVQALQRRHEALERDLAAIEEKVLSLCFIHTIICSFYHK